MQTILLVDDEEYILDSLSDLINDVLDVGILQAENGAQALEIIKSGQVDMVLSDIHMPVMNGLELLKNIRELGLETPVIFLTGYADRGSMAIALRLGASDFVEKPYEEDELIESIEKGLERANIQFEIQNELEKLCRESGFEAEQLEKFKEAKRKILNIQLENKKKA